MTRAASEERRHIVVSGRVQGVGFRYAARREAARLGVRGWVRNTDEGRVEIVAEGSSPVLDQFQQWCHRGPAGARVTNVVAISIPADKPLGGFDITY